MRITSQGCRLLALPDQRATRSRSSTTSCGNGSGRKNRTARNPSRNAIRSVASVVSAIANYPFRSMFNDHSRRPEHHPPQRHPRIRHSFPLRFSYSVLRALCVFAVHSSLLVLRSLHHLRFFVFPVFTLQAYNTVAAPERGGA